MKDADPICILEFDLFCKKPEELVPTYRIYIDNDLIAERTYTWNNQIEILRERCELRLTTGQHIVKIENLEKEQEVGYYVRNATLNNDSIDIGLDGIFTIKNK